MAELSGVLLLDKPGRWTSHDAAQVVRSRLPGRPKVGHTGTLDPMATGLLVLLVGPATRSQAAMQKQAKTYRGRVRLGVSTETGDLDGKTSVEKPVPELDRQRLQDRMTAFLGKRTIPAPAYSAIKFKGRPLYYYARRGIEVPRKDRPMEVYRWDALEYSPPDLAFELECGSGTYVRALAEALGGELGCGAVVAELRRTRVGPFRVEDALDAEKAKTMSQDALIGLLKRLP